MIFFFKVLLYFEFLFVFIYVVCVFWNFIFENVDFFCIEDFSIFIMFIGMELELWFYFISVVMEV